MIRLVRALSRVFARMARVFRRPPHSPSPRHPAYRMRQQAANSSSSGRPVDGEPLSPFERQQWDAITSKVRQLTAPPPSESGQQ